MIATPACPAASPTAPPGEGVRGRLATGARAGRLQRCPRALHRARDELCAPRARVATDPHRWAIAARFRTGLLCRAADRPFRGRRSPPRPVSRGRPSAAARSRNDERVRVDGSKKRSRRPSRQPALERPAFTKSLGPERGAPRSRRRGRTSNSRAGWHQLSEEWPLLDDDAKTLIRSS